MVIRETKFDEITVYQTIDEIIMLELHCEYNIKASVFGTLALFITVQEHNFLSLLDDFVKMDHNCEHNLN